MPGRNLTVPGADLYYEIRGTGPVLLIGSSGDGDANQLDQLVTELVDRFTVVTYDRRGLRRSVLRDTCAPISIAEHADDAYRLLDAVADGPAAMLGCSTGALIGLHLVAPHPDALSVLVAHEPPVPQVLPPDERASARRILDDLHATYRRDGWLTAVRTMGDALGIDPATQELEPGATPAPITPDRAAGFAFLLDREIPAIVRETVDTTALLAAGTRIVPAHGNATPARVFHRRCVEELGALVGAPTVDFPGGHNGGLTHPRAFADRVVTLLAGIRP
ncbi:alpha/beta fold hydrolase [Micromonospora zhanjiangensis]|uniref:Alpha/beta fold hydrolase n=1 Tax=Micromonospora zhanjiangensis TaxID=1522057 RepID=A0ABV8KTC4_9ACTN